MGMSQAGEQGDRRRGEQNRNGNENGQAQLSRPGGDRRGGPRNRRDEREMEMVPTAPEDTVGSPRQRQGENGRVAVSGSAGNGEPVEAESRVVEPATKEEMMDVEDRTADLEEAVGGVQRCMTEMAGSEDQEREVKDLMGIFDEGGQDGDQEERDGSEDDEESEDSDQIGEQQNGGGSGMVTQDAYERQQQRLDFRGRVDEEADEEGEEEPMPGIPRSLAMAGVGLALLVILWRLRSSKKNTQNGQNGQSESGQDEEKDVPLIER